MRAALLGWVCLLAVPICGQQPLAKDLGPFLAPGQFGDQPAPRGKPPVAGPAPHFRDGRPHFGGTVRSLAGAAATIEYISLSVSDIEEDGKGVPVLIRQYLKAGWRLIAFNVDPSFSNSLDALILVDLRTAPVSMLDRCMGRSAAKAFLEFHARHNLQSVGNLANESRA